MNSGSATVHKGVPFRNVPYHDFYYYVQNAIELGVLFSVSVWEYHKEGGEISGLVVLRLSGVVQHVDQDIREGV